MGSVGNSSESDKLPWGQSGAVQSLINCRGYSRTVGSSSESDKLPCLQNCPLEKIRTNILGTLKSKNILIGTSKNYSSEKIRTSLLGILTTITPQNRHIEKWALIKIITSRSAIRKDVPKIKMRTSRSVHRKVGPNKNRNTLPC